MKKLISLGLFALFISIVAGCSSPNAGNPTPIADNKEITTIVDSSQFSRISELEVESLLGKPDSVEKWEFNSYDATTLLYNSGNYEFLIIDDSVVRFTYIGNEEFDNENDLFKMFGIVTRESITKVTDTGLIVSYHSVADNVGEFYVMRNADDSNKIDMVKITYDLRYFE